MAAVIIFTVILKPKKIKSVTVSIVSPSICHEVREPYAMILVFWMLNFKPAFLLSSWCRIPHSNPRQEKLSLSNKRFTHGLTTLSTIPYCLLRTKAVPCAISQPICDFFVCLCSPLRVAFKKSEMCLHLLSL